MRPHDPSRHGDNALSPGNAAVFAEICGGLANQMFQYAAGLGLARHLQCELKLDLGLYRTHESRSYQLDKFGIDAEIASPEEIRAFARRKSKLKWLVERHVLRRREPGKWEGVFDERGFGFDPALFEQTSPVLLRGYWQSQKYFEGLREELIRTFRPKVPLSEGSRKIMERITGNSAVSIHVRRGDYVNKPEVARVHGTCSLHYYRRAVDLMTRLYPGTAFYVFSDDPQFVRETFDFCPDFTLVEGNEDRPHEDMQLMSRCDHHIIANSSFSWWGAWLNPSPDKTIIAPRRWFSDETLRGTFTYDLYPEEWITLE